MTVESVKAHSSGTSDPHHCLESNLSGEISDRKYVKYPISDI